MHLEEGELRAFQDGELETSALEKVRDHLAACAACRERSAALLARTQQVEGRLAVLSQQKSQAPLTTGLARAKFTQRLNEFEKEDISMFAKIFSRRYRLAWAIVGIIALLAFSMAFEPVQAFAEGLLGLFRVQQVSVVEVNPGNLPEQLGSSSQLEALFAQNVVVEENGETQKVASAEEAGSLAGIPVRLPEQIDGQPSLMVQPGGRAEFQVDLERIHAILDEIGRSDIRLPKEVDGTTVTVEIPDGVVAQYGKCEWDSKMAREYGHDPDDQSIPRLPECTTLVQMLSPVVSAPEGLDLPAIGQAFLQVLGMNPEEAERFAQNIDWATTFVLPIPRYGASYSQVTVDGVNGTLILQNPENPRSQYMLIWIKDGIVYALTGPGNGNTATKIADSLK